MNGRGSRARLLVALVLAMVWSAIAPIGTMRPVEAADGLIWKIASEPSNAPSAVAQEFTFAGLGYPDQLLRGIFTSADYFVPGPGDQQVLDGNYLRLIISHSEILLADRSTLSVSFNNTPVASYRLTPETAKRFAVQIEIPTRFIRSEANQIRLSFYMRVVDEGCKDIDNPGLTALVSSESAMHYELGSGGSPASVQPDLARFPAPWFRVNDPVPSLVNFVIPTVPSPADYSAMASISAKIGQIAGNKIVTTTVSTADRVPANVRNRDNMIIIGTPESNPLVRELNAILPLKVTGNGFSAADSSPIGPDQGVIQVTASPFAAGKSILVLSGGSEEAIRRAAQVMATTTLRRLLDGPTAVIADRPNPVGKPALRENGRVFTLSEIGYDELVTYGLGTHSINLTFDAPAMDDRNGGYLDVVLSHSLPLLPDLSNLSVVLNGVPIASIGLRDNNANRSTFRANIPPTTLQPGQNSLQFVFTLSVEKADCSTLVRDAQWGVIHRDTEIHLPQSPSGLALGLQYYPFPFVRNGGLNDTILTLPKAPKAEDLTVAMQLATDLGRQTKADAIWFEAMAADSLTDSLRRSKQLIAFGLPSENPLIEQVNKDLPLQFDGNTLTLRQANQDLVQIRGQGQIGVIQTIVSPWAGRNGDSTVILIHSATIQEGLEWTRAALAAGKLGGNVATVARDGRVSVLDLGGPQLSGFSLQQARNNLPLLFSIVVGLLLFGLIVVMLIQSARDRRARAEAR